MAQQLYYLPRGSRILVTGANGFIGSNVVHSLLELGYKVRGTVRAPKPWLDEMFRGKFGRDSYESVVLTNFENVDTLVSVMDGVSGVAHVASDVSFSANPEEVVPWVLRAVHNVLEAASRNSAIRRVVMTSSAVTALFPEPNKEGVVVREDSWNDEATKLAYDSDAPPLVKGLYTYAASKTEGEKAAWRWMEKNKPGFQFNTVLPDFTLGRILHEQIHGSTMGWVTGLPKGDTRIFETFVPQYFCDVIDIARLHVAALLDPNTVSRRLFGFAAPINLTDIISVVRKLQPNNTLIPEPPVNEGRDLSENDIPVASPGQNEVLVKLTCTGLCRSELRAVLAWGAYNSIIGHEGVGTVVKAGPDVSESLLGERVGVKWLYSACNKCSVCKRGFPNYCAQQLNTSRHVPGTLQQYVIADARFLTLIPGGVADEVAAPLLCAGFTMVGALSKLDHELQVGDFIVISGSGGGLGHIGVQIASRIKNLRVIAVDSGDDKRALSLESGAEVFFDYKTEDVVARVREFTGEGAHATIVVPGTKEALQMAPNLVRNMGFVVNVGLPPNNLDIPLSATLCTARGLTFIGSSVGTEDQLTDLLQAAAAGKIAPSIEVFEFSDVPTLIEKLRDDGIMGRAVITLPQ
ncbi:hypothetical protein CBS147332_6183 [Penicillium roqueforti]|nr:hypothetical protein CBS147332_6183 [Penicillium roqueforti]KAI3100664.1 hypothetical protein CBS147331_8249 [Penicillium roqueforti]